MNIGDRIKLLREEKHMTMEELGKRVGSLKQTIYKYENGIITNIPLNKVEKIASVLGVPPAYLMGWMDGNHITDKESQKDSRKELSFLNIPEKFKDVMVAFSGGAEGLTQADIDNIVRYIELVKNQKK